MKFENEKLNIAMLGHKRIPSREGGIEIVVEELSTRMVKRGNSVTCFNRRGHHVSGKEFDSEIMDEYKGIRLKYLPTVNRKGLEAMLSSFFGAVQCALGKFDVVHFHAEGPCAMMWIPKLFGKRCVVTIHGLDHQRTKWGKFASTYILFGEKCAVRFADEIIVLSKSVQNYFMDTYGKKTTYISNGVNPPKRQKACMIVSKYGVDTGEYILFVARLVPEKGLKYLIEAFKQVRTDKKLIIAGGASDTDSYVSELKARSADDDRIIFTGFIQGSELEELYSNAYFYVLPSDLEGMPLSLLEAMSYGNCCLVSDIPECTEVVEGRAMTFRRGDIDDLREKMQMFCDSPEAVTGYRTGAAEFICRKCDWDDAVEQTLQVYRE